MLRHGEKCAAPFPTFMWWPAATARRIEGKQRKNGRKGRRAMSGTLTDSPHLTVREGSHQPAVAEPSSEELDAYLHLSGEEIAHLVLCSWWRKR